MIPMMNIVAWGRVAPWAEIRQVEQDLIISRAIVELFADPFLHEQLRFRGGTALNKLHFPVPLRYSEDIDLVRTTAGPIKPILDQIHAVLDPWLGAPAFDQSPVAPKMRYRVAAEDPAQAAEIRLKIEINTREIEAYDPPLAVHFAVDNPWFEGAAQVATFSHEEMLATKLRALLQRDKGRDLFDLAHALDAFEKLNTTRIIEYLNQYLAKAGTPISRAMAEQRMFAKLRNPNLLRDMRPLLPAPQAEQLDEGATQIVFCKVFSRLVTAFPGAPWAKADVISPESQPISVVAQATEQ